MHIPDGYLSPIVSMGLGAVTVPAWAIATQKVKTVLNDRTIPLLAIFSALSFTIMMFNIPVPGGTTAHGVGATLAAIVVGPWAAIIAVSVALIIQALFFGDGGILAIFANCLTMGVIMPLVGYAAYRLLSTGAPLLSPRRAWAAGIAAYIAITASALAAGILLGIQPLLFTENGHPMYSPYPLAASIPAMLIAHMLGASIVEALITGLGVAYMQKRHPEYLTALKGVFAPDAISEGTAARRPLWLIAAVSIGAVVAVLAIVGLLLGGGDPAHLFGADWAAVDWASVVTMLLFVAVIGVVLVPLAYFVLPRRYRRVGAAFTALAVIAPLGLIAPGFAYGEGSTVDVKAAFGYVPQGLRDLSGVFSAPLSGYDIPLPFFAHANNALWRAAIGYEITGVIGILLCGGAVYAIATLLGRRLTTGEDATSAAGAGADGGAATATIAAPAAKARPSGKPEGRIGWLESTLSGISGSIERAVFTEEHSRKDGWLQRLDPRAKIGAFLLVLLAASFTGSLAVLLALYALVVAAAVASLVPLDFFVRRVWMGIPFFAGIIVIPAIFLVPGERLFELTLGPITIAPSIPGLTGAVIFVTRVGVSVSIAVLLVMTTPWASILKALRTLRVPQVFVLVLSMSYRYIFLFLHTTNGLFLARKSRMVGRTSSGEQRRWISGTMGTLLSRAFKMSNDVYSAMLARGFAGELRAYAGFRMRPADWAVLGGAMVVSVTAVAAGRLLT